MKAEITEQERQAIEKAIQYEKSDWTIEDKVNNIYDLLSELRKPSESIHVVKTMNDKIQVELTNFGAEHLNKINKEFLERFPMASIKTDYKEFDIYENQAYSIFQTFSPFFHIGGFSPFINLALPSSRSHENDVNAELPKFESIECLEWRIRNGWDLHTDMMWHNNKTHEMVTADTLYYSIYATQKNK